MKQARVGQTSTLACETNSHPQCCQSTKTVCDPDATAEQVASHPFAVSPQAWNHRRVSTNMLKMTNVELQQGTWSAAHYLTHLLFVAQQFLNFQNKSVEWLKIINYKMFLAVSNILAHLSEL